MKVLKVYLGLYAECFRKAFKAIAKNAWTVLLPIAMVLVWEQLTGLTHQLRLGMAGGIALALARAALLSSYLYFVGELVVSGRVTLGELKKSIGAYFWSLVNVFFVIWIVEFLLLRVGGAQGAQLLSALYVVAAVALNAAPEVIYLRGTHGGLQTFSASFEFLKEDWIPWFAINIPLLAGVLAIWLFLPVPYLDALLTGAALHVVMVFRGHLFKALTGSSHRQRMFYRRAA